MLTLTRTPLSLVTNTHYAMGGDDAAGASTSTNKKASKRQVGQQQKRRSARNADKENGNGEVNGGDIDDGFAFRSKTTTKFSTVSRARGVAESVNGDEHGGSTLERPSAATGNKRKRAYDEDDDGFTFTRVKNKRSKISPSPGVNAESVATSKTMRAKATLSAKVPPPVAEEDSMEEPEPEAESQPEPQTKKQSEPVRRKGRKRGPETEAAAEQQNSDSVANNAKPMRRKPGRPAKKLPRSPGDDAEEVPPLQVEKKRARQKSPVPPLAATKQSSPHQQRQRQPQTQDQETIAPEAETRPVQRTKTPPVAGTTKIALPFADTPIIRRNQEMRRRASGVGHSSNSERDGRGSRRSSLGQRGRRASSLIDSGRSSALPHDAVDTTEFFKHIEADLPEPRRMRQLLTWCGTRALGDHRAAAARDDLQKEGGKANGKKARSDGQEAVRLTAREIQSQVLKDFGLRSDMSNWFSRPDDEAELGRETVLKKPNPRNEANEKMIKELEAQLARLQAERTTWEALLQPALAASPTSRIKKNAPQPSSASELAPILPAPTFTLTRTSTHSNSSALIATTTINTTNIPSSPTKRPAHSTSTTSSTHVPAIDVELLTQSNAAIASSLRTLELRTYPVLQEDVRRRLDIATQALEFDSDRLAAGVHALTQYRGVAGRVAGFVLDRAAEALEVRSRRERSRSAAAGALAGAGSSAGSDGEGSKLDEEERGVRPLRDVLRGLSRLENR